MSNLISLFRSSAFRLCCCLMVTGWLSAQTSDTMPLSADGLNQKNVNKSLLFMENRGQISDTKGNLRPDILFSANSGGARVFLSPTKLYYQFSHIEGYTANLIDREADLKAKAKSTVATHRFSIELQNSNPDADVIREKESDYTENYFFSAEHPAVTGVKGYEKITFKNVYPGIDWVLYSKGAFMEYDFVVHPGANPNLIRFKVKDADKTEITAKGELKFITRLGEVIDNTPKSFSGNDNVATRFVKMQDGSFGFNVATYDKTKTLRIDPSLTWSTYYGNTGDDRGYGCTIDSSGNIYLVGEAGSANNIASGGYQNSYSGGADAMLVKFNSAGVRLWSTYYGGSSYDLFANVTVDSSGNIYASGSTISTNNISYSGYQSTHGGGEWDAYLVKFTNTGGLSWATYYGGSGVDFAYGLALDTSGNVYLTGYTSSASGIASGGYDNTLGGTQDAFIAKFTTAGSFVWGTYYGGSGTETCWNAAIDSSGNIYIAGETTSTSSVASGGYQTTYGGGNNDGFLVKMNSASNLSWATYYGGSGYEYGKSISIDAWGNVYFSGASTSTSGIASGGFQNTNSGNYDAFTVKFNISGGLIWGTYYGGSNFDSALTSTVDAFGNLYLGIQTQSSLGLAYNAFDSSFGGYHDTVISKFNSNGTLAWGNFFGGSGAEIPRGITLSGSNVYVAGYTESSSGVASNGYQNSIGGSWDAYLLNIYDETICLTAAPTASAQTLCGGATVANLTATGSNLKWYTVSTGGIALATTTALATGTYYVSQTLNSCESTRTAVNVTVNTTAAPIVPTVAMNNALNFDGVNDYVKTGNSPVTVTGSFTVEAWVRPNNTSSTMTIVSTRSSECAFDFKLMGGNLIHGDIGNGSSWLTTTANASFTYGANEWVHVAYVVTTTGYTIYANGQQVGAGTYSGTPMFINTTRRIDIGNLGAYAEYFAGSIDEVKVYNIAFTQAQIQADMFSTSSVLPANNVFYYNFNSGTANGTNTGVTTLYNQSGSNALNGTLYNFALTGNTSNWIANIMPAPQYFCNGATVANLNGLGSNLQWYVAPTGGSALASTTTLSSGIYYASATINGCESSRVASLVTIFTTAVPTASAQTFCNSATVANLVATGNSLKWYTVSTGGTALATTTALATGTYYVSQTANGCESARAAVSVIVNITAAPTASAQTLCGSATVANLTATGSNLKWYTVSTGGSALAATTALATGTYYVSQTVNSCESTRTAVSVTVNATTAAPTVPTVPTVAMNNALNFDGIDDYVKTGNSPVTVTGSFTVEAWVRPNNTSSTMSIVSTRSSEYTFDFKLMGGNLIHGDIGNGTSWLTTAADASFTYSANQWVHVAYVVTTTGYTIYANGQQVGVGTYSGTPMFINNIGRIDIGNLGAYAEYFAGSIDEVKVYNTALTQAQIQTDMVNTSSVLPANNVFYYNFNSGTANGTNTGVTTLYNQGSNALNGTLYNFALTGNTSNWIANSNAPASQTLCSGATVADLTATGSNLQWYVASTGGSALASTTTLSSGTYYVSQTLNGCESSRVAAAVVINTTAAPTVSAQTFCSSATVANLTATGSNLKWYTSAIGGSALVSTTALSTGTYYVSQTVYNCESARTAVSVIVNITAAPTASAQAFCNSAIVANLIATGSNLKWYTVSTGGTALATTTALTTGTYYVSQTLNSCESARTAVSVIVNITAAPTASAQSFCGSATVANLEATGNSLQWYTVSTGGTALATTTALATGTYYVSQTINSCESNRTPVSVIVNTLPLAPVVEAQTFCGNAMVSILMDLGSNLNWYTTASGGTALANTTALTTGTYYVSNTQNGCESNRTPVAITIEQKTWTGTVSTDWNTAANWCDGIVPTVLDDITIPDVTNNPEVVLGTAYSRNLTLSPGAALTVNTGTTLYVHNSLAVDAAASLEIKNNAALMQSQAATTNTNSGNITFHKYSNTLYRLDYTLWASPVAAQNLLAFSPATILTRFYEFSPTINLYNPVTPSTTNFETARGYLIRMPNALTDENAASYASGAYNFPFDGVFTGVPNNGNITYTLSSATSGYNAVGNPYPSPISLYDFFYNAEAANGNAIDISTGIYLWRKRNNSAASSYATLTLLGYASNPAEGGGAEMSSFFVGDNTNWTLAPGQGFFVKTKANATTDQLTFNNSMRRNAAGASQAFFKSAASTASRFWLNIYGSGTSVSQTLVGYIEEATLGLDYGYDATKFSDNLLSIYSLSGSTPLVVQARPTFSATDIVPIGYNIAEAGTYTIALDNFDGVFEDGITIYLKDNVEGIVRNLNQNDYSFTTEAGTFENRFEIVYTTAALATDNTVAESNNVIIFNDATTIGISATNTLIKEVTVYDIRGRKLYANNKLNTSSANILGLVAEKQVLIIEVTTNKGKVSKRIVY